MTINEMRNKELQPLIHCITNPISINQCANAILAVGCRPIMAEHPQEVGEITDTAQALLLNLGNITDTRMESMMISAEKAYKNKIPIVIDMVGIACSGLRHDFVRKLIGKYPPAVIKGNYSEINALANRSYKAAGVDAESGLSLGDISNIAVGLSEKYNCIVLSSGKTDIITDSKQLIHIKNGSPQMAKITGTGCMLGALCACYLADCRDITAVAVACAVMGISGELSETDKGNGSFMVNLMDNLSVISDSDIEKNLKMEVIKIEKN